MLGTGECTMCPNFPFLRYNSSSHLNKTTDETIITSSIPV